MHPTIAILGTGGTIAGRAASSGDNIAYVAGQVDVRDIVAALPGFETLNLECRQLVQLDSKDMSIDAWLLLAREIGPLLKRPDLGGIVITHGTDTLEETAYFLQRVFNPSKPIVLTAAMRPATALSPDGPPNLRDAIAVAMTPGARGVVVALGGQVLGSPDVRKTHTYAVFAFGAGENGPIAFVEEGDVRQVRDWPETPATGIDLLPSDPARWPWVEIVTSHAAARGDTVRLLLGAGVQGIVVAATGNGTVHHALEEALDEAVARGVPVLRASRVPNGPLLARAADKLPASRDLSPTKARIELALQLLTKAR